MRKEKKGQEMKGRKLEEKTGEILDEQIRSSERERERE